MTFIVHVIGVSFVDTHLTGLNSELRIILNLFSASVYTLYITRSGGSKQQDVAFLKPELMTVRVKNVAAQCVC